MSKGVVLMEEKKKEIIDTLDKMSEYELTLILALIQGFKKA